MNETILYYKANAQLKSFLDILKKDLNVHIQEIHPRDCCQSMGYLLGLKNFNKSNDFPMNVMNDTLLYFAFMDHKQVSLIIDLMHQAQLPPIPYKAVATPANLNFTFYQLYQDIHREHELMSKR